MQDGTPPTAAMSGTAAPERLRSLLHELEELAPSLSEAALGAAARRVALLAASRGVHGDEAADGAGALAQAPVFGLAGAAALADGAADDDKRSEVGSAGSLDVGSLADDASGSAHEEDEGGAGAQASAGAPAPRWFDEERRWPGGPVVDAADAVFNAYVVAPADAAVAAELDGDEHGDELAGGALRDARLGAWHGRDSIGLTAHGREMYCDYCDLGGGVAIACMARDMLQQSRVAAVVEKHRKKKRGRPGAEDVCEARKEARHACYRSIVAWQWADPLGAEQRVRLPACVEVGVRRLFPNPVCGAQGCGGHACDYGVRCVRHGHYTGFRTAAESRALRDGSWLA